MGFAILIYTKNTTKIKKRGLWYLQGKRNNVWIAKTVKIRTKNNVGNFADFSVLFKDVVSMRQLHMPSFLRLVLSSFCKVGLFKLCTMSIGSWPFLFLIVREAPFIRMARTGLPEANLIELLMAR